ncbi:MAG: hypothetical protein ACXVCJ_27980, partial [Polyangiales bacterium]
KGLELAQLQHFDWLVEVLEFPADTVTGRVRVRARREVPSIRVDAWVSASTFTYWAQRELPVVVDHVAIASGTTLRLFHPDAAVLDAEPRYATFEKTRAPVACGDIALSAPKSTPKAQKAAPREVVLKSPSVPLYDAANGKLVFTLVQVKKNELVSFDAFEKASGFERVHYDGDVRIDGWVRSSDVRAPDPGDLYGLGGLGLSGTGGGYGSSAPKWAAKVDTEIRLGTDAKAPVVGLLEKGARVWITKGPDWSEIRLVDAAAMPPKDKHFFVRTVDLEP